MNENHKVVVLNVIRTLERLKEKEFKVNINGVSVPFEQYVLAVNDKGAPYIIVYDYKVRGLVLQPTSNDVAVEGTLSNYTTVATVNKHNCDKVAMWLHGLLHTPTFDMDGYRALYRYIHN